MAQYIIAFHWHTVGAATFYSWEVKKLPVFYEEAELKISISAAVAYSHFHQETRKILRLTEANVKLLV